ncbi:alpha/beta hydrolase family protein [Novosphingobium sp. GV055]|nr:alpha/beta hydrolase family protein [Novosphingobium sp. GV055]PUB06344.1 alpha/beta hydrolase family protein [Novosphingobium sp. GV061]PUB22395.1 alpha/beta hydrolase family protein [Novosphingobium sp. GV079]PUB44420.1 alpha/beta hydrolase family protein [Novosphingobium sp. GV027]
MGLTESGVPFALVGASLGGGTALRALAEGMCPAAVVLVDIVPNPDPRGVRRVRDFMLARPDGYASLDEAADAIAAYNPHRPRPADVSGLRNNLREGPDGRFHWHWDPAFIKRDVDESIAELAETLEGARSAGDIPVLLIKGGDSDVVNDQGAALLREALPNLEIAEIAGAGHMVAGDRNDAFNAAVLDFLDGHFPANQTINTRDV